MGAAPKCPTCGRVAPPRPANRATPFCSDRCRLLDLGKWMDEAYRVPAGLAGDGAVAVPPTEPDPDA